MSNHTTVDQAASPGPASPPGPSYGPVRLSSYGRVGAFLCFLLWMVLFGGGILIDTEPYRMIISPGGVAALAGEEPGQAATMTTLLGERSFQDLATAWMVVMIWFLPLNLALLCTVAAVLGAFGSIANLDTDQTDAAGRDRTNPYVSALLRGFFVYLIMISGLLILDHEPFSNPGPEQYIRLAGLLSMFAFMVNYNPQVFNRLLILASDRVEARHGVKEHQTHVEETSLQIERATQVTSVRSSVDLSSGQSEPPVNGGPPPDAHVAAVAAPDLYPREGGQPTASAIPPVRLT